MAGALGVQLGGGGWNSGPLVDEAVVAIELVIVAQAERILFVAGIHAAGLCWATRLLLLGD